MSESADVPQGKMLVSPGPLTRGEALSVGIATILAALASYGVLLIAARTLTPALNADFLAYWASLFGLFGVLAGVQNETIRAVGAAAGQPTTGPRVLVLGLLVGLALATVLGATSPLWGRAVLGHAPGGTVLVLCVAVVAFAGHAALAGALSGIGRWTVYAGLVGLEATTRFALVGVVAAIGATMGGFELAAALAAGTWLVVVALSPAARRAASARADVATGPYLRRVGHSMVAAASSAILVVGFPVLLRLTSTDAVYSTAAPLILAVSLTRAPLLIPLGAYQGVAITHFLAQRDEGTRALRRIAVYLIALGAVGAVAAFAIGPWLMAALFGADYEVGGLLLGGLTASAVTLALLTLTGAAVLALDRHVAYSSGWVAATVVSLMLLLLPIDVSARTVLSLAVGPLVGVLVHAVALTRASPSGR